MCGIAGIIRLGDSGPPISLAELDLMNRLQAHRGPDGASTWCAADGNVGFSHRRLAIIELGDNGFQPMVADNGLVLVHNGEIYNHVELRRQFAGTWNFKGQSDSEVILAAYSTWGKACVDHLRGMFAFAIWDPRQQRLFAARDRLGIKPFYYAIVRGRLIFASEIKTLLPFLDDVAINPTGLTEYLTFQFTIGPTTLFKNVTALAPGHRLEVHNGNTSVEQYWDVDFLADPTRSAAAFQKGIRAELNDSIDKHLRADVPIGTHLSGGIDSTLIAALASQQGARGIHAFHGKFTDHPGYDESSYAVAAARHCGLDLHQIDISADDFVETIGDIIYTLDQPTAGPGSFPQYMVSRLAARHVKVVLGGQGGDEIFAGYARYLIAHLGQALKAAMDVSPQNGNRAVAIESIAPSLQGLSSYRPMLEQFLSAGLFDDPAHCYFRLVDRFADLKQEVAPDVVDRAYAFELFQSVFNSVDHVHNGAYLDRMTYFDLKTLLPALLHVEDRVSMAHGLESRTPLADQEIVEFSAQVPAAVKFPDGQLKGFIKTAFAAVLPPPVLQRRDKMGFPVPLSEWISGKLQPFMRDIFSTRAARERDIFFADAVIGGMNEAAKFSRKYWGLLSLELWHRSFLDRGGAFRSMHVHAIEDDAHILRDDAWGLVRQTSVARPLVLATVTASEQAVCCLRAGSSIRTPDRAEVG